MTDQNPHSNENGGTQGGRGIFSSELRHRTGRTFVIAFIIVIAVVGIYLYIIDAREIVEPSTEVAVVGVGRGQGIIQEITRPPSPGDTPYPNGLVSIHLTNMNWGEDLKRMPDEIAVFAWGMRDHRHTAVSTFRQGQTISFRARRWSGARDTLGNFSRSDFDNLDLLRLKLFFADEFGEGTYAEEEVSDDHAATDLELPAGRDEDDLARRIQGSIQEIELRFLRDVHERALTEFPGDRDIVGRDGWYLGKTAARALLSGTFWAIGDESESTRLLQPNALNAIVAYSQALEKRGIDLILVPAIGKLFCYPDEILNTDEYSDLASDVRLDRKYFEIYEMLRERGIEVLDVYPAMRRRIGEMDEELFRKDDHHWSSYGDREVAKLIHERIKGYAGFDDIVKRNYVVREASVTHRGAHWRRLTAEWEGVEPDHGMDVLVVREVQRNGTLTKYRSWRESPVMLMGDSFVVSLSTDEGEFGAGLRDHLSELLGFPIDTVDVLRGGANRARVELSIDPGSLDTKKVLIWCFYHVDLTRMLSEDLWKIVSLPGWEAESPE